MKLKTILLPLALASACIGVQSSADVLETKSKGTLNGQYQGGTADSIRFKVGNDTQTVSINDIVALTFTGRGASQGATGTGAAAATGAAAGAAAGSSASSAVNIPAGTSLRIVMDTGVDSSRDKTGTRFSGKTAEDVMVDGKIGIPKGSPVTGRLNQAKEAGRLAGQSMLELDLTDVTVNGQRFPLMAEPMQMAGAQEGRKTARRAGA